MGTERWVNKANSLATAWAQLYGKHPTLHTTALCLSVAQSETWCGDAWPDEHNWGATTLRSLNAAEREELKKAGLTPTVGPGHKERAAKAMEVLRASGLPLPQGVIHCDSAPHIGPYFVWFASFPDDVKGAAYFLKLLAGVEKIKPARRVLDDPNGTPDQLARAMYAAGYYTGFHKPTQVYPDGKTGAEKNIEAYASNLRKIMPGIVAALVATSWTAGASEETSPTLPAPKPLPDVSTIEGQRSALNALGCGRPLLPEFGPPDRHFIAAVGFFQGGNVDADGKPLDVDGGCGPLTQAALKRELAELAQHLADLELDRIENNETVP